MGLRSRSNPFLFLFLYLYLYLYYILYYIFIFKLLSCDTWPRAIRVDDACLLFGRWGNETLSANINSVVDRIRKARPTTLR